jgi:hypothetical protein
MLNSVLDLSFNESKMFLSFAASFLVFMRVKGLFLSAKKN